MKAILLFAAFIAGIIQIGTARTNMDADTINFEKQREHVNSLLEERSKRFGDFDNSLQKKTGVFGIFKSKKDLQKSTDILREIVLTDNRIFLETKKLLDIKGDESDRYEGLAAEYDQQISAYMRTINKLQIENEKLRSQINELDNKQGNSYLLVSLLIIVILMLCFTLYRYFQRSKPKI